MRDAFACVCVCVQASRALRMDAQTLVHACKDAGLLGKALSRDSVNVIFARVRPHTPRTYPSRQEPATRLCQGEGG